MVGLSQTEAERRLRTEGANELPKERKATGLHLLIGIVSEPMIALLLVASILYFALGELRDAIMLGHLRVPTRSWNWHQRKYCVG